MLLGAALRRQGDFAAARAVLEPLARSQPRAPQVHVELGLLLAAAPIHADVNPALPAIPDKIFNVTNYGALGDGVATNTGAIQSAINAASAAGGGVVEIPEGIFLCGPIQLASKINLHLAAGALLRMLPLEKYPAAR